MYAPAFHVRDHPTAVRWTVIFGLVLAGSVLTGGGVPLYDGIGFPDEPYRFVDPRAGAPKTSPPSSSHGTLDIVGGTNPQDRVFGTDEMGPQVLLDVRAHALHVAASHARVSVDLEPVALTAPPARAVADSNLYDVLLTSPAGAVTAAGNVSLTLRAVTASSPLPVMMHRSQAGGGWRQLPTHQIGRDNFGAAVPGPGQYLLVRLGTGTADATSSSTGLLLIVLGAVGVAVVLVIVLVRASSQWAAS